LKIKYRQLFIPKIHEIKKKIILSCSLGVLFILILMYLIGVDETWRLWKIPVMSPNFADLRIIISGAESFSEGYDPRFENPKDPWLRNYNYPKILILIFSSLGITQDITSYLGIAFILFFLIGVCLIAPNVSNLEIIFLMAAILSSATLFSIERGNIDLIVFFLVAVSVVTINKSPNISFIAIIIG